MLKGRKVSPKVRVLVVPGSQEVKRQAIAEGLPEIFRAAGCEWREPGCSMCIAMNGDQLAPGQYSVSTSNRNFEGRQGKGGRTFLASPLTAAASAITGVVTDVRTHAMKPFTNFESRIVPLPINNIDTDQIIPARFLKTISKEGLDKQLFCDWRYDAQGTPQARISSSTSRARKGAQVLLAGDNFGCGSSREHAPWALTQFGFRAVISTSFADIFKQNSLKNSLLPIVVPADVHAELFAAVDADPRCHGERSTCPPDADLAGRPRRRVSRSTPSPSTACGRRGRAGLHPAAGSGHRGVRSGARGLHKGGLGSAGPQFACLTRSAVTCRTHREGLFSPGATI